MKETAKTIQSAPAASGGNSIRAQARKRLLRNRSAMLGLIILLLLILCAIFADFIAPYGYDDQDMARRFLTPSAAHPFGTDNFGRDIFSRVIYGARISLSVGLLAVTFALLVGGAIGVIAGYYSDRTDAVLMRIMDVFMAIPSIILAISIAAALGTGLVNLMIAVGISSIPSYARVARASTMTIKNQEFIESARVLGAGNGRIILKYILPNIMAPLIVQATVGVAYAILSIAALSFIGLGIAPPTPEWGSMLASGREHMLRYGHLVLFPGLAIMVSIFSLNLLGDGLRDALDPKMNR